MRARDLVSAVPTVRLDSPAFEAVRLLAVGEMPGLVVVDDRGVPVAVLDATQVLRMGVPAYIRDDAQLAHVVDEAHADVFLRELDGRTVAQCLPGEPDEVAMVRPTANLLEIAAIMTRTRCPLVAVVDRDEGLLGVVTLASLLHRVTA